MSRTAKKDAGASTTTPDTGSPATATPDTAKPETGSDDKTDTGSDDKTGTGSDDKTGTGSDDKTDTGSTATPDTAKPETGSDDKTDTDSQQLTDDQKLRLGRHHPIVEGGGPKLDTRPGNPRVCKAPRCGRPIEKRGVCGYHWATARSIADPA